MTLYDTWTATQPGEDHQVMADEWRSKGVQAGLMEPAGAQVR